VASESPRPSSIPSRSNGVKGLRPAVRAHARRARRRHIGVQHHEGQTAATVLAVLVVKIDDGLLLPAQKPEVAGNPAVVFVHFAVAFFPIVELAWRKTEPSDESGHGKSAPLRPVVDEVDDGIAHIVGNPTAL